MYLNVAICNQGDSANLCVYLSCCELVCVFQLVCLAVGNSHWLRNNYPHDLNIIQLISFISQVITHNRVGPPHSYGRRGAFAGRTPPPSAANRAALSETNVQEPPSALSAHLGWFMRRWRGRSLFIKMSVEERGMTKRARAGSLYAFVFTPHFPAPAARRFSSLPLSASHIRFAFNSHLTICHDRAPDSLTLLIYIWMPHMSGIAHCHQCL